MPSMRAAPEAGAASDRGSPANGGQATTTTPEKPQAGAQRQGGTRRAPTTNDGRGHCTRPARPDNERRGGNPARRKGGRAPQQPSAGERHKPEGNETKAQRGEPGGQARGEAPGRRAPGQARRETANRDGTNGRRRVSRRPAEEGRGVMMCSWLRRGREKPDPRKGQA